MQTAADASDVRIGFKEDAARTRTASYNRVEGRRPQSESPALHFVQIEVWQYLRCRLLVDCKLDDGDVGQGLKARLGASSPFSPPPPYPFHSAFFSFPPRIFSSAFEKPHVIRESLRLSPYAFSKTYSRLPTQTKDLPPALMQATMDTAASCALIPANMRPLLCALDKHVKELGPVREAESMPCEAKSAEALMKGVSVYLRSQYSPTKNTQRS